MSDYIIRGISTDKSIRFFAVKATQTVQKAIDIHNLSITTSVAMGRLLIGGLLMGAGLKNPDDLITLRIDGDGPIGVVLVTTTGTNTIKGYVQNPQVELPFTQKGFAVSEAIGKGSLSVIRSIHNQKPYTGHVELITSEIAKDICYYYQQSEQIDTIINLGILIENDAKLRQAGGFMVQCMPDATDEMINRLNQNAQNFPNLSDMMDMGYRLEDILKKHVFKDISIEILEKKPVAYYCNCKKSRFQSGIKLLKKEEIQEMIDANETITAECHFCNQKYEFTIEELKEMFV
jgi:molecular chaperone Hsp33